MRLLVAPLLLISVVGAQVARPKHNSSYVRDDDKTVRGLMAQATDAAKAGRDQAAIEALQTLLLQAEGGVVPLVGRELFVSPRRWATIMLLSEQPPFGAKLLEAWRRSHDSGANRAIRAALARGDESALLEVLARYPAATAAPGSLLALSDRALQRGEPDQARGFLLRAPEHVAQSDLAAWLASPAYTRRRRHLDGMPLRRPAGWPTLGGSADRARRGDALPGGTRLELLWETPVLEDEPPTFAHRSQYALREHSPVLPFYPVFDQEHVYVHLGTKVAVIAIDGGKLLYTAPDGEPADELEIDRMLAESPGLRCASVHAGVLYFNRVLLSAGVGADWRSALTAFDIQSRRVRWEIQPGRPRYRSSPLEERIFFRGAPAVVGERLYVYGAAREESEGKPSRKEEAYLFCFRSGDGELLWRRFLGYGDTEAGPSLPPQSGFAPAVASGVVVVVTGVGVAAGLDAGTGEILWLLRYDRKPVRESERLTERNEQQVHIGPGWFREAPRIVGERVFLTPMDSDGRYACWLRGWRDPQEGGFYVQQWYLGRSEHALQNSLLEQVAGVAGGRIYYVGRRDENHSVESYQTVVSNAVGDHTDLACGRIPPVEREQETGRRTPPEVFGRATVAGNALLVPTRRAVYRFDVGRRPAEAVQGGSRLAETPPLAPYRPPPAAGPEGQPRPPAFGTLVAVGGRLYAVSATRVICYLPAK